MFACHGMLEQRWHGYNFVAQLSKSETINHITKNCKEKHMNIVERFINYTKFDTQSAEDSQTVPSTSKQLIFAKYLKEELEHEGLEDVEMDEKGYIYATLKANVKKEIPTIGFISHYDTSPDASGANIKARIVKN